MNASVIRCRIPQILGEVNKQRSHQPHDLKLLYYVLTVVFFNRRNLPVDGRFITVTVKRWWKSFVRFNHTRTKKALCARSKLTTQRSCGETRTARSTRKFWVICMCCVCKVPKKINKNRFFSTVNHTRRPSGKVSCVNLRDIWHQHDPKWWKTAEWSKKKKKKKCLMYICNT